MASRNKFDFGLMKRLFRLVKPYRLVFNLSVFMIIVLAILGSTRPAIIMEMVNQYSHPDAVKGDSVIQKFINMFEPSADPQIQLLAWTILLLGLLVIEAIIQFFSSYMAEILGQSIIRDMRVRLYKHFNSFNLKYFDRTPNGTVVTRMVADIEAVAEVFSTGFITIVGEMLKIIFVVGLMLYTSWELTLLALIPIPLLLIATRIFAKAMKKTFQNERLQVNRLNTFVQEHISGMSIVQLFNRQKVEEQKFKGINKDHRQAHVDAIWAYSIFFPIVEILSSLSIAAIILWGTIKVSPSVDPKPFFGVILGFVLWIHMLYRPIRQMADRFNILQRGMVRAERVFEILDRKEHIDNAGSITDVDFTQKLSFQKVWFAYKDENWVLKGIDFEVEGGKSVALVGTTGAGKSTIINLLTRFYEFQKGEILIGDKAIRDIELNILRQNIAIVLQDVFLFSDTIYNNITMGDENITEEQVIAASKKVGAHDFIMNLPGGYQYNVRERGGVLSVGQRQLISFIRAYVYDPKILILDEATASVDSESEEMIQKATTELQKGRTSIVIAHRLSTIVNSDEILVIDAGLIIERGSHQQLIDLNGQYRKLYELNFA